MKFRPAAFAAALLVLVMAVSGCSIANTSPDQVAMQYGAGPFDSKSFVGCVPSGTREINDVNDDHFYYPQGQRTYTFDSPLNDPNVTKEGADAPALKISTKGNRAELIVRGTITFTLNTSCEKYKDPQGKEWEGGVLQRFNDMIGRQKDAYASEGGEQQHGGWRDVLNIYLGGPAEKAMDNAGLNFAWEDLYGSGETKAAWEKQVLEELPKMILAQAGDQHFVVNNVQLQKPDVPPSLRTELDNNQAAELKKKTADTDKSTAENFPGGLGGYMEYQRNLAIVARENATAQAIREDKVKVIPVPAGSPVIIDATPK